MRTGSAPIAVQSRSMVTTDSSRLRAVGQTTQRFPSNSSGLAASGPTRSVPAIGWQAMNDPGGSFGSTAAIAAAFTLPTSITSAPGSSTGAISAAAPPRLRTGVASTTSAAPACGLGGRRRRAVDDPQRLRAIELLLGAAPGHDLGDRAGDPRPQRDRAADLPGADHRQPPQGRAGPPSLRGHAVPPAQRRAGTSPAP